MLSIGILFDFLIDFTEVLSGDGGVVATSCLHFLVTTSIRAVGEGCRVCAFSESKPTQRVQQTQQIRQQPPSLIKPAISTTTTSAPSTLSPMDKATSLRE
jgi:hypothetical protein